MRSGHSSGIHIFACLATRASASKAQLYTSRKWLVPLVGGLPENALKAALVEEETAQ